MSMASASAGRVSSGSGVLVHLAACMWMAGADVSAGGVCQFLVYEWYFVVYYYGLCGCCSACGYCVGSCVDGVVVVGVGWRSSSS